MADLAWRRQRAAGDLALHQLEERLQRLADEEDARALALAVDDRERDHAAVLCGLRPDRVQVVLPLVVVGEPGGTGVPAVGDAVAVDRAVRARLGRGGQRNRSRRRIEHEEAERAVLRDVVADLVRLVRVRIGCPARPVGGEVVRRVRDHQQVEREVVVDRVEAGLLVADLLDADDGPDRTLVAASGQAHELAAEQIAAERELEPGRNSGLEEAPVVRILDVLRAVDAMRVLAGRSRDRPDRSAGGSHQALPSAYRVTPPTTVGPSKAATFTAWRPEKPSGAASSTVTCVVAPGSSSTSRGSIWTVQPSGTGHSAARVA